MKVKAFERIKSIRSTNLFPKIGSASIAVVISALWLFPDTVSEHKILSKYIDLDSLWFTITWLCLLALTGTYWIMTSIRENRLTEGIKRLQLESVQNKIFQSYLETNTYRKAYKKKYFRFTKDDLIEHISHLSLRNTERIYYRANSILRLLKVSRTIDLEVAQAIADIIIERATVKKIITVDDSPSISTVYLIEKKLLTMCIEYGMILKMILKKRMKIQVFRFNKLTNQPRSIHGRYVSLTASPTNL